jgi:hypothetical protein
LTSLQNALLFGVLIKEQIEILENAFELLEEYPHQLDDRYAGGADRCTICHGLIGGGGHKENVVSF